MHVASITLGQKLAADTSGAPSVDSHHYFQGATAAKAISPSNQLDGHVDKNHIQMCGRPMRYLVKAFLSACES